jgi:hypothetical protein
MASARSRTVARAYGYSIAIWSGLSLLMGWQYRIFDKEMNNTHARLRYLYSGEASFSFCEAADHTATSTIVIPALGSDPERPTSLSAPRVEPNEGNHARIGRG